MKNLKDLNLQELSVEEQVNIDGGALFSNLFTTVTGICVGICTEFFQVAGSIVKLLI